MIEGKEIVFHIGLPKTGTTSIQRMLLAHRDLLLAQAGVLNPFTAPDQPSWFRALFRESSNQRFYLSRGYRPDQALERRQRLLDSLDSELRSVDWKSVIISSESMCDFSKQEHRRLFEWSGEYASERRVLVCVRHPVDWVRSVVQQLVKHGDTLEQIYRDPPSPRFRDRILSAIEVFGLDNVQVFDFETMFQTEVDPMQAFGRLINLDATTCHQVSQLAVHANESLTQDGVNVLDALNRRRPRFVEGEPDRRTPRRAGAGHELRYLRGIGGPRFDLPDDVKQRVQERARDDVRWLNDTYGLDLYSDLADEMSLGSAPDLQPESASKALAPPGWDSVVDVLADLLADAALHRLLERGIRASQKGDIEGARRLFEEAQLMNPVARRPRALLAGLGVGGAGSATEPPAEPGP